MPQDAFTLKYLCEELNERFSGAKINRIVQPSNDELVLTVYTGKRTEKLYISVNPARPRIGLCAEEKSSPIVAPNFCMLMRKHLLSATINDISLVGFDRIVKIQATSSSEITEARKKTIYVELMGRYSNVILTEDGKVLGGNRGINNFDNGVRPLIVGRDYFFPPQNNKKIPTDTTLIQTFQEYKGEYELYQFIAENVQGLATSTAKEIVYTFEKKYGKIINQNDTNNCTQNGTKNGTQNVLQTCPETFFKHLNDYIYKAEKQPCLLIENGLVSDVCVYPYNYLNGQVKTYPSLLEAEEEYFTIKEEQSRFKELYNSLSSTVSAHLKKAKKRVQAINAKIKDAEDAETEKIKGELLLANIYKVKRGDTRISVENYYNGTVMEIELDENLSPSQNAEKFYKRYNKKKRTLSVLSEQKTKAQEELEYFLSVSQEVLLCENHYELKLVKKELEEAGVILTKQQKNKKPQLEKEGYRKYLYNGFTILAGRNNTENDRVTTTASSTDVWVHAKDYHSSHVIIKAENKKVPESVVLVASEICAYYSGGRNGGKTEIVYTEKKNVKKPKGAKPGFCTYVNFKSIVVEPNKHQDFIKEA